MPEVEPKSAETGALAPAATAASSLRGLSRWLVEGPDPAERNARRSSLDVLLPWPVRLVLVFGIALLARLFRDTGFGQEIAWGLQVGALAAVAIGASFWLYVLVFRHRRGCDSVSRREKLVCLAWAASARQAHKSAAMTMGEALNCASDDRTAAPERRFVITLEPSTCE